MQPTRRQRPKAGHRRWAPQGQRVPGCHRGDIMSPAKRSSLMSRIRGRGTGIERAISDELKVLHLAFETHARDIPGRPDVLMRELKVAIFVDGDFWHGFRFPLWRHKLSPKWRDKIEENIRRDQRNFARLRRQGWTVVRIWEHQVEQDISKCVGRIRLALKVARTTCGRRSRVG